VKHSSPDPYCYPGTDVLRNLLDIRDASELAAFEAAIVSVRLVRLSEEPLHGPFNLHRLQQTHRRIFDGIYPWAGQLRRDTGTMKKHREAGYVVSYGDSSFVEPALETALAKLRDEAFLRGTPTNTFAQRAAFYYSEIDAIHPFREGNSRTLRQFFSDLARENGFRMDWTSASTSEADQRSLIRARDLAVMQGDLLPLTEIFAKHLMKSRC
jgi:cell filamentation protein